MATTEDCNMAIDRRHADQTVKRFRAYEPTPAGVGGAMSALERSAPYGKVGCCRSAVPQAEMAPTPSTGGHQGPVPCLIPSL